MMKKLEDLEIKLIGSASLELITSGVFPVNGCNRCLYWEDPDFLASNDHPEILLTRKLGWFRRVSAEFDPCGLVILDEGTAVGFSEFALPAHFPGIETYGLALYPDEPFIACLSVRSRWRGLGIGRLMFQTIARNLKSKGCGSVQSIVRIDSEINPSGPLDFWKRLGARVDSEADGFALVRAEL